jgi:hypothetical protein
MPGSHLRFVRTLDFGMLDGRGARAAAEIREAEDALIAFTEAQQSATPCTSRPRSRSRRSTSSRITWEVRRDRPGDGCPRLPDPAAAAGAHGAAVRGAVHEGRRSRCRCDAGHRGPGVSRAQGAAAAYDYLQESLTDVITQARDLRARIHSGTVPEKDARKLLADLRKQRKAGRQDRPD